MNTGELVRSAHVGIKNSFKLLYAEGSTSCEQGLLAAAKDGYGSSVLAIQIQVHSHIAWNFPIFRVLKSLALDSDGLIADSEGGSGFPICSGFQYALFTGAPGHSVVESVALPQKGLSLETKDQEKQGVLGMKLMFEPLGLSWTGARISGCSSPGVPSMTGTCPCGFGTHFSCLGQMLPTWMGCWRTYWYCTCDD